MAPIPFKICLLLLMSLKGSLAMPTASDSDILGDELTARDIAYMGDEYFGDSSNLAALEARDDFLDDLDLATILLGRRGLDLDDLDDILYRRAGHTPGRIGQLTPSLPTLVHSWFRSKGRPTEPPLPSNGGSGGNLPQHEGTQLIPRAGHTPGRIGQLTPSFPTLVHSWLRSKGRPTGPPLPSNGGSGGTPQPEGTQFIPRAYLGYL